MGSLGFSVDVVYTRSVSDEIETGSPAASTWAAARVLSTKAASSSPVIVVCEMS